jgi:HEAT repeat protein
MRRIAMWGLVVSLAMPAGAADEQVADLIADLGAEDAYTRKSAADELVKLGAQAIPALAAVAKDKDSPLRLDAVLVLQRMDGAVLVPAVPALAQALRNPNEKLRLAAARTLAKVGPAARPALPELIDLGDTRRWNLRFAARDTLAAIGPEAGQALIDAIADGDPVVPEWAPGVFFDLGARTVPAALKALKGTEDTWRAAGADALAAAGKNGIFGVQALMQALHDDSATVRRRAALALGHIGRGAADALPALIALANDPERRAVGPAIWAMGAILRDAGEAAQRKPIPRTELRKAIELGLQWLARHQDEDGRWDADGFDGHAPKDDPNGGPGGKLYDVGVTGLALLAFLESGMTRQYARTIRRGLRYLVSIQDDNGIIGTTKTRSFIYLHATSTLALCEAGRFSRDPVFRRAAQRGLDFIAAARNPDSAWRYKPRGKKNDTSVTGWMVMCLKAGEVAGFRVDPAAFLGALNWVRDMTDPKTGRAGYNSRGTGSARPEKNREKFPKKLTRAMTAEAVLVRLGAGQRPGENDLVDKGVRQILDHPPRWSVKEGYLDMYYWFQATRALYQVGDSPWRRWQKPMTTVILNHQHPKRSGSRTGSWDPIGVWGEDGGRVYSTALMLLCLESISGYTRPFELKLPSGPKYRTTIATLKLARQHREPTIRKAAEDALAGFAVR